MKKYCVTLTRAYKVSIIAKNEEEAKQYVEYFLDDCNDISSEKEKVEKEFKITTIKPTLNEATEVDVKL